VAKSPAGGARPTSWARDLRERPGERHLSPVEIVGHGGLAVHNEGGSPSRDDLNVAMALGVDRLELDLCCTSDGRLVVRHDVCRPGGAPVSGVTLRTLRAADPALLTLDEAVEHLDGRVPLLLDLKQARAAELLGMWLRRRHDLEGFAVCTENLPWLLRLRFAAPRLARWPSFPDLGDRRTHHVQSVMAGLWRSHASLGGLIRGAGDLHRAARDLALRPQEILAHIAGLPWRGRLPADLVEVHRDMAPAGLCVHQWVISEELVGEAHLLGLHVNAWTVNNPFAARAVVAAGVDSVTTDRVELVRIALHGRPRPRDGAPLLRAAARTGRS